MHAHRRTAAATLTLGVLALALAACGGSDDAADDAAGDGPADDAVAEAWNTSAGSQADEGEFDFDCPAGGSVEFQVWGGEDGQYTSDSSICVAAVHAGVITAADGGTVHVTMTPGLDTYGDGFEANGVTSVAWTDPWELSFEVSAG
ncbi:LCCL domain-containing protein [Actinotalea fermentans]|uniref:LCCL domain-containing protein n=1 Tax=Actinotalea fermentans TaxID=43671 RepID=A0A511YYR4_9CELL|nr:LCCL domain-containing protein [Actinotalea fermentans]KGM15676.1 hypothetical protein N867_06485 [Actinotalea fermentans ATCC 43279 = JCM 9966 = DSM 3133]GEN80340.1 hypothetical protein AFE02nite_20740 [Actinotalea fermentans]